MQFYQKLKIVFFLIVTLLYQNEVLIADAEYVEITFISNCGFMLSSGNKTVIIDALHTPGYYLSSKEELSNNEKLINLEEPFTNIDLVLVTHSHPDHFHSGNTAAHLVNNPAAKLIANEDVMLNMQNDSLYTEIQTQLVTVNPDTFDYDSLNMNGISVLSYPIRHLGWHGFFYPHIAFVIYLNGFKIYFGGDNIVEGFEFPFYRIDQKEIDIAFIRFWNFFEEENIDTLNQFINPKTLIPMHFLYGDSGYKNITQVEDSISKFQYILPETFIFRSFLESIKYPFVQEISDHIKSEGIYSHKLFQNYPNPFNLKTRIIFYLYKKDFVEIDIFNIQGRKVESLVSKIFSKGTNYVNWDTGDLAGGIYFYRIKAGGFAKTNKCLLIK